MTLVWDALEWLLAVCAALLDALPLTRHRAGSLDRQMARELAALRDRASASSSNASSSTSSTSSDAECAPPRKKLLVLDLDETLIHSTVGTTAPADMAVTVTIDRQQCTLNVLKRPHVARFLRTVRSLLFPLSRSRDVSCVSLSLFVSSLF